MDIMVFDLEPAKIFINIGTNDLNVVDYSKEDLIKRYESILTRIEERLPETRIYIMAYYPVNGDYDFGDEGARQWTKVRSNARINEANEALEQMAQRHEAQSQKTRFININKNLFDIHGNLKHEYSIEGVHMYANGYHAILDELMMYVREQ
jgi:lysophospholipase L1-like esterase